MTVILDLDDVLANLREALCRTLSRATGVDSHWRSWTHYDLRKHYDVVDERLMSILVEDGTLETCRPEPGASVTTKALRELGFNIAIVTARGWHPRAEVITRAWLDTNAIVFDELIIVPLGADKLSALGPVREIAFAVDDHSANVSRYQAAGVPVLLMDRPWNADIEAERIHSLDAVVGYASAAAKSGSCGG